MMQANSRRHRSPTRKERAMPDPGGGAVARSRNGRTFRFSAPVGVVLAAGDVVAGVLDDGRTVLGQVVDPGDESAVSGDGQGVVVGALDTEGRFDRRSRPAFSGLALDPATPDQLGTLREATGAHTPIGTWLTGETAPAAVRAAGFNRHTFLCGQSGSGKTYALGVLLERLLIDTDLRVAVLDPNADFVRLGETLPGADPDDAARVTRRPVRVLRGDRSRTSEREEPLRMRFRTMPRAAQAAVLQLDPVRDSEEYNALVRFLSAVGTPDLRELFEGLKSGTDAEQRLSRRMENLGLDHWEVFALEGASAADVVTGDVGVTVMDLGGFGSPGEPVAVALDLFEELWARREERVPTLIVVDEAHNLAGASPETPAARLLLDRIIRVAAEGRKYGLWLLLSSQRPSKIHPQVLSQCDNLVLMRMNSPADVAELGHVFGFVPPATLDASTGFLQGEMLLAGPIAPLPMLVRVRERLTVEGGSDVAVPLAGS
jgi:DNA helicase HerA-like ATPase